MQEKGEKTGQMKCAQFRSSLKTIMAEIESFLQTSDEHDDDNDDDSNGERQRNSHDGDLTRVTKYERQMIEAVKDEVRIETTAKDKEHETQNGPLGHVAAKLFKEIDFKKLSNDPDNFKGPNLEGCKNCEELSPEKMSVAKSSKAYSESEKLSPSVQDWLNRYNSSPPGFVLSNIEVKYDHLSNKDQSHVSSRTGEGAARSELVGMETEFEPEGTVSDPAIIDYHMSRVSLSPRSDKSSPKHISYPSVCVDVQGMVRSNSCESNNSLDSVEGNGVPDSGVESDFNLFTGVRMKNKVKFLYRGF